MDLVYRQVTGTYVDANGNPRQGYVEFTPSTYLVLTGEGLAPNETVQAWLDDEGKISTSLLCNNSTGVSPAGWKWIIEEKVPNGNTGYLDVPDGVGALDITYSLIAGTDPPYYGIQGPVSAPPNLYSYAADLGTVTAGTPVIVTHNLNTYDVTVEVHRKVVAGVMGSTSDLVDVDIRTLTATTLQLTFADSAAANSYRVVVTSVGGTVPGPDYTGSFNVRSYGAVGDGTTDDSAAIQTAIDAAFTAGGGLVSIPAGTYRCNVVLKPKVTLEGQGVSVTILKAVANSNANVITGLNFATLTNKVYEVGDITRGTYLSSIRQLTIDGDKANQSAGWGIQIWGMSLKFADIQVQNCNDGGIWTEFTTHDAATSEDLLECFFNNIKVVECGGDGWRWRGPHDSYMHDIDFANNAGWGLNCDTTNVSVLSIFRCNAWMNTLGSYKVRSGTQFYGCIASGSTGVGVYFIEGGGNHRFHGTIFGHPIGIIANGDEIDIDLQGGNCAVWVQLGETAGTYGCSMVKVHLSGLTVGTAIDCQKVVGPIEVSGTVDCITLLNGDLGPNPILNIVKTDSTNLSRINNHFYMGNHGRYIGERVEDIESNLLTIDQASLENSVGGWYAVSGATIARSTLEALDGSASLEITTTGTASNLISVNGKIPVIGGRKYSVVASAKSASLRSGVVGVQWYDSVNAWISSSTGTSKALKASSWTSLKETFTAPDNAVTAEPYISTGVGLTSEKHYFDCMGFKEGRDIGWSLPKTANTVSGSKASGAALSSLLTRLVALGLITDSTVA